MMTVFDTINKDAYEYKRSIRKQREIRKAFAVGFLCFVLIPFVAGLITDIPMKTKGAEASTPTTETVTTETEQKYIVRYALAKEIDPNTGVTTYEDLDGNLWEAIDAPTNVGQRARILFDSKETKDVADDEIIDITE